MASEALLTTSRSADQVPSAHNLSLAESEGFFFSFLFFLPLKVKEKLLGVVAHACNPSTPEAEAGEWRVPDQPGLHSEILLPAKPN